MSLAPKDGCNPIQGRMNSRTANGSFGSRTVLAGFAQNVGSWYISGPPSQESGHSRYKPTGSWRPDITLGAEVWWQSRVERSKRWFDRILASWSGQDISPCVGS